MNEEELGEGIFIGGEEGLFPGRLDGQSENKGTKGTKDNLHRLEKEVENARTKRVH